MERVSRSSDERPLEVEVVVEGIGLQDEGCALLLPSHTRELSSSLDSSSESGSRLYWFARFSHEMLHEWWVNTSDKGYQSSCVSRRPLLRITLPFLFFMQALTNFTDSGTTAMDHGLDAAILLIAVASSQHFSADSLMIDVSVMTSMGYFMHMEHLRDR